MTIEENNAGMTVWVRMALSAFSGILLTLSMPGFDVPLLGWIGLVPLLVALFTAPPRQLYPMALVFGLIFSFGVHNWYPSIFSLALGYFLIFAVATFYAGVLHLGVWLTARVPMVLRILALPVVWSSIEFIKFIAPVVEDWWFVMLAASQWRFPPALQILAITGFPGLGFMVMLVNVAIAGWLIRKIRPTTKSGPLIPVPASLISLVGVALIVIAGAIYIPAPNNTFKIAVLTDMVNQDEDILALGNPDSNRADNPAVSRAVFEVDASLTRQIADQHPAFVVWPENEFINITDPFSSEPLGRLAKELNTYIAADTIWKTLKGPHDTALLMAPAGKEVMRRAKINVTPDEIDMGIAVGPKEFPVLQTPFGTVSIAVCWDVHRLWIMRELARAGAELILLPMDNDFNGTSTFPPFHAANGVFRAAENRMAFGLGTTNGVSMVIDPYGRITAEGGINQRGVAVGETFVVPGQTFYTKFGDWFGWLLVSALVILLIMQFPRPMTGKVRKPK